MASTNTSHRPSSEFLLRLRRVDAGGRTEPDGIAFDLYDYKAPARSLDLVDSGVVSDSARYAIDFLSTRELGEVVAYLGIGGEEPAQVNAVRASDPIELRGRSFHRYAIEAHSDGALFHMAFGFTFLELRVNVPQANESLRLFTRDIPCTNRSRLIEGIVSEMLDELTSGEADGAVSWMLGTSREEESRTSLLDGPLFDSSKSLKAYVALVELILAGYEEALPYLRTHACCRTAKHSERVDARKIRQFGRRELDWMARNADLLHEVAPGSGIAVGDRSYSMRQIQTEVLRRDFDNRENRGVLAFLEHVTHSLSEKCEAARAAVRELREIDGRLRSFGSERDLQLALVVVRICAERELPLVDRIETLRMAALRLLRLYREALPGVSATRYRLPRRTKVFQEVRSYASIYSLMLRWERFGRFDLRRDGLLLHTFRIDQLYEYYALYRMLGWLQNAGFVPDAREDSPISQVSYSLQAPYFANETQVANSYRLTRGDERIHLLYEPVVYGDEREEGGVALHRTSVARGGSPVDSYWLPDYVLVHEVGGRRTTIVLDAKFMDVDYVQVRGAGRSDSPFWQCHAKYKGCTLSSDGGPVDAMWLLCGRSTSPGRRVVQESSWARSHLNLMPDGAFALSPRSGELTELFALLGIGGRQDAGPAEVEGERSVADDGATRRDVPAKELDAPAEKEAAAGPKGRPRAPETKSAPRAQRPERRVNPTAIELLQRALKVPGCDETLLSARSSHAQFGLNHPALMESEPSGRSRGLYADTKMEEGDYFVLRDWSRFNLMKLRAFVERQERTAARRAR